MPTITPDSASLIQYGDCNGHGGRTGSGYKEVHGDYGYDMPGPDIEVERILDYALAYVLLLCNMFLKICNSHLVTDRLGNTVCVISKGPRPVIERRLLNSYQLVSDMLIDTLSKSKPPIIAPTCPKV